MMVTKLLGLKKAPKLDDAADALALALTAASMRW
jgi:Holliday junction resolvasome RuvABC endonuclease subunit